MAKKEKKSKEAKKQKQEQKRKRTEEVEDIDAILESFKQQQETKYKVTEELDCEPPSRRANCTLTCYQNELILFGGEYYDGQKVWMFNDFYRYNIEKNEWEKSTSPNSPGPRSSHQIVITPSGLLYMWGGEFVSPNETNFFHYKDFWMMDLKGNSWERLEIKCPPPRSGHRMVQWKQYIVMFGGFYDQLHETKYYDDLWLFDTNDYKWHQVVVPDPKPTPRSGFQFFCHGDQIILYGGYSKTKKSGMMHTDCWNLKMSTDPKLIRWEKRKKSGGIPPGPRSGCSTVYHKGKGIMFGGVSDVQEDEETIESVCHQDAFQYVIDSNKWYPLQLRKQEEDTLVPGARFNAALAIHKNTLFMFGGIVEAKDKEFTLCDFWSLNLDKLQEWTRIVEDTTAQAAWVGSDEESGSEDDESDMEEEMEDISEQVEDMQIDHAENDPAPGEKMNDYFQRTVDYWEAKAMKLYEFKTQKGLRRKAFDLAQYRFLELEPENKKLQVHLKDHEAEKTEKSTNGSRNRR